MPRKVVLPSKDNKYANEYFDTKQEAIESIKEMYERSRKHIGDEAVEEALIRVKNLEAK